MNRKSLIEKVEMLPNDLVAKANELMDDLYKNYNLTDDSVLQEPKVEYMTESEEELHPALVAELDRRYQAYLKNPESAISLEEMRAKFDKRRKEKNEACNN